MQLFIQIEYLTVTACCWLHWLYPECSGGYLSNTAFIPGYRPHNWVLTTQVLYSVLVPLFMKNVSPNSKTGQIS